MKTKASLVAPLALLAGLASAQDMDYAQAEQQAQVDAKNPAHREWYLGTLRPVFSAALRDAVGACLTGLSTPPAPVGMVAVLDAQGRVSRIHWRERHALTECLAPRMSAQVFPAAPVPAFYMGVQLGGSAATGLPLPPGTAASQAAALGAPTVPKELDCHPDRVQAGVWSDTQALRGLKAWVVIGYELKGDGRPQQLRVLQSSGSKVLERFALDAVIGDRYRSGVQRSCQTLVSVNSGSSS